MADDSPPAGPSDRAVSEIGKPGYPKPSGERLDFAAGRLREIEQYIAPNSAVMASLLIRAMLARNCTTAEAMWAVYKQIESGRYSASRLDHLPSSVNYIVGEHNEPAGLNVASGVLHIDGEAGDWGMWVLTLHGRDHQATEYHFGIDSTPALPKPPAGLIRSAERAIPYILANVEPEHDGAIELIASHLSKQLQDANHALAAAQWAIHGAIQAGRLRTGLVEVEMPSFLPCGSRVWQGGERGTIAFPMGKPAPFDAFKVVATESLWAWWRSLEEAVAPETASPAGASQSTEPLPAGCSATPAPASTPTDLPLADVPNDDATLALLRVFTNGLCDDRIRRARQVLADGSLTANEKLTKIDALIPFPATASADRLAKMLQVSKQAILKTDWWLQNRKGEKFSEVGRRRAAQKRRAEGYEPPCQQDDGE